MGDQVKCGNQKLKDIQSLDSDECDTALDSELPLEDTGAEEDDWREEHKSLKSKMEYCLVNRLYTDLVCVVGEERREIHCHSFILRASCKYFSKKYVMEPVCELKSFSSDAFEQFLLYLYADKFTASGDGCFPLLHIAKAFGVQALIEHCYKVLGKEITIQNASAFFVKAVTYKEAELAEIAKNFIKCHAKEVFGTPGFMDIPSNCLNALVSLTDKNIDELSLFCKICSWGESQCERQRKINSTENIKELIQDSLKFVQFHKISAADFAKIVYPSGMLRAEDAMSILANAVLNPNFEEPNSNVPKKATGENRPVEQKQTKRSEQFVLERFPRTILQLFKPPGTGEKISFMIDQTVFLNGVGVFARASENQPIKTNLRLTDWDENRILLSLNATVDSSRRTKEKFDLLFEKPFQLKGQEWYTLEVEIDCDIYPYGVGAVDKYEIDRPSRENICIQFKNPKNIVVPCTVRGQFPTFHFSI